MLEFGCLHFSLETTEGQKLGHASQVVEPGGDGVSGIYMVGLGSESEPLCYPMILWQRHVRSYTAWHLHLWGHEVGSCSDTSTGLHHFLQWEELSHTASGYQRREDTLVAIIPHDVTSHG